MNPFDFSAALDAHARMPAGRRRVLDDRLAPAEQRAASNRAATARWREARRAEARELGISYRELMRRLAAARGSA